MTPKEQFLKGPHAKSFADTSGSEAFREACNYAFLQITQQLKPGLDSYSYIEGAKAFKAVLETIAIPEEPDKPQAKPSLNYDAYNSPARPFLNNPGRAKPAKPTS